jgi:hypothetical protein
MPDTAASLQTTVDIPYLAAIAVRRGGGQYVGIQRGLGTADFRIWFYSTTRRQVLLWHWL